MKTIFVTGAAGYIGSHCCKLLSKEGFTVIALDSLARGHAECVKWGTLEVGDLRDPRWLNGLFQKYKPSAVLHLAGFIDVAESVRDPHIYYDNNIVPVLTLLQAMHRNACHAIIFSSTCAVYAPQATPSALTEDSPCNPLSPYGESKYLAEHAIRTYSELFGYRYINLRFFNASGADPEGEIGEWHEPETHALPLLIQTALGQRAQFNIYGSDYPTSDGTAVRDYVHVMDLATAHLLALRHLLEGKPSDTINLGSESGFSVKQLVTAVEKIHGASIPIRYCDRRAGDPPLLLANAARAKSVLGWKATHSDIDTIIRTALAWHTQLSAGAMKKSVT